MDDKTHAHLMLCLKCGYTLNRLGQNTCPECGTSFDPNDESTFHRHIRAYHDMWLFSGLVVYILINAVFVRPWNPDGLHYAVFTTIALFATFAILPLGIILLVIAIRFAFCRFRWLSMVTAIAILLSLSYINGYYLAAAIGSI